MRPRTAPGVPVINVNNNCATGGTALYLAKLLVQGGQSECVLVVGFEKARLAARPPVPNPPAAPTTAAEPDNMHHIAAQMEAGSLAPKFPDRENPVERHFKEMARSVGGATKAPPTPQMFGNAAREHMSAPPPSVLSHPAHFCCMWTPPALALLPPARFCWARPRACPGPNRAAPGRRQYGSTERHLAQIAAKNHAHGRRNPRAQSRVAPSPEEVLSSPTIFAPLTKLQCCPTSDGAAAAVVCSAAFLDRRPGLRARAVQAPACPGGELAGALSRARGRCGAHVSSLQGSRARQMVGMALRTDRGDIAGKSCMDLVGFSLTRDAAAAAFAVAGMQTERVAVVELHDCFSANVCPPPPPSY